MIDKRIGKRIKERREELGYTQDQFAEKMKVSTNYLSTIERGSSFPRCERLILLLNTLETSADSIFCDVLEHSTDYKANALSDKLAKLPQSEQSRILDIVELMIKQAEKNK